jgi:hypothetical protein
VPQRRAKLKHSLCVFRSLFARVDGHVPEMVGGVLLQVGGGGMLCGPSFAR